MPEIRSWAHDMRRKLVHYVEYQSRNPDLAKSGSHVDHHSLRAGCPTTDQTMNCRFIEPLHGTICSNYELESIYTEEAS